MLHKFHRCDGRTCFRHNSFYKKVWNFANFSNLFFEDLGLETNRSEHVVHVALSERSYDVTIKADWLKQAGFAIRDVVKPSRVLIVSDPRIASHWLSPLEQSLQSASIDSRTMLIPPGEASKTLQWASHGFDQLAAWNADRQTAVVALGGGVVGDLAGFVAACYARGLPFVQIPTTLLAMVDASVGGKVAVDHPLGKNLIGAFHQPALVGCDPAILSTLPRREYISGLAEIVKYGIILDANFFAYLEKHSASILAGEAAVLTHIIARSVELKAQVVSADERETTGLRAILNLGHTFAHAFETADQYAGLLHGEAVAIGMVCACRLAELHAKLDPTIGSRTRALCDLLGLPVSIPARIACQDLIATMRRDKKSVGGALRFILPTSLGSATTIPGINESLVKLVLEELTDTT